RVTATLVPTAPVEGAIEASEGAAAVTVKVAALLVPPAVVTLMLCGPVAALAAITNVVVIWVAVTVGAVAVIPAGRFSVAPVRLLPAMVTATLVPTTPVAGAIEVSAGVLVPPITVKVTGLLVPAAIEAVMFCGPPGAVAAMARVARIRVALVFSVPATTVMP